MSGPYNLGGVKALNITQWVQNAVAWVKANPAVLAVEVLNEPYGSWFWGPEAESAASEAAYARLLKAVHTAFVAKFGSHRPLILASYGGSDSSVSWGEAVWNESLNGGIDVDQYIDGVTVHPYGGTGSRSLSALGARSVVMAAHAQTREPVYITEVGWSTAVGHADPETGLQWSEVEQATNIYNFIAWARSTGYVAAVMVFGYRDYGSTNFYGVERWNNSAGPNGSRKPSYRALQEAASEQPLSL
jgi:Glycosyl hydrolase catalytic core